jgi:hypothetical protein
MRFHLSFLALALFSCAAVLPAQAKQFQGFPRFAIPATSSVALGIAMGDVDGNGTVDVVLANFSGSVMTQLLLNDGLGNFKDVSATNLPASNDIAASVALADVDLDMDLDIILGARNAPKIKLFLNNGKGVFTDVTATQMPATQTETSYDIAVGDVDFDVDLDIIVANTSPTGKNRLYINDGRGTFTDATSTQFNFSGGDWGCTLADIDNDFDLDAIFTASSSSRPARIFINDSKGNFTDETSTRLPSLMNSGGRKVIAHDWDKDGDRDLFFANYNAQDRLFDNDGKGVFTEITASHLPALSNGSYYVQTGDIDEDGDEDIVTGNYASAPGVQNTVFLNDGSGKFTDGTAARYYVNPDRTTALGLADFDCDGDLDIFNGNWKAVCSVAFNLHRGIYAAAQPTIGRTWNLDFYGAPGYSTLPHVAVPAVSIQMLTPRMKVPELKGYLCINPSVALIFPSVAIPSPGGKTTVPINIPNLPSLKNLQFYMQAAMGQPPTGDGFTNALADTIK